MRISLNFGVRFSVMRCWQISSRLDHRDTSQHNTNTPETFVVVRSCGTNVFWTKNVFEVGGGLRNTPNCKLTGIQRRAAGLTKHTVAAEPVFKSKTPFS